jgi:anthranilate/para-aminobenzoate synthase component I
MIVDLLRNDLGRICRFGSIEVEKICDLEQHPTLFHLVSTIKGDLRDPVRFSEIIKAVFPCGSITGAPKISTMKIIDRIEKTRRGLPMGAIGLSTVVAKKESLWRNRKLVTAEGFFQNELDLAVAIRTMVIKENQVIFNVGGGIVIDSLPESEYQESLTKAKALLRAINGKFFTD